MDKGTFFKERDSPRDLNDLLKNYIRTQAKPSQNDTAARILKATKVPHVYKNTIKSLFILPDLLRNVFDEEWDAYLPEDLRNFLFSIKELYLKKGNLDISDWIYLSKNTNFAWVENFLAKESINSSQDGHRTEKTEKTFYGCMIMFKMATLEKKCQDSLSRIKNGEHSENTLREYNAIIVEIKQLKEMFGTIE